MTDSHNAQALVLMCIDFRFHQSVVDQLKVRGLEAFDLKADAGAVKYLVSPEKPEVRDWIIQNIEIAKRLHQINSVVLINHADCGAYGGNEAFESDEAQLDFHRAQLKDARTLLSSKFPDLSIQTLFAKMVGSEINLQEL